jgi:hypothetical protein
MKLARELQICLVKFRDLHERTKQSDFQRSVAMDGDHETFASPGEREDVMSAVDTRQSPSALLHKLCEPPTRNLFQRANSTS